MTPDEDLSIIVTIVQGPMTLSVKLREGASRDEVIEEADNLLCVLYGSRETAEQK